MISVEHNPRFEGPRSNYRAAKRSVSQPNPRNVQPRLEHSNPNDPITGLTRRKVPTSTQRPGKGANQTVVYPRLLYQNLETRGEVCEGDVIFVSKHSALFGTAQSRMSRVCTWRDVNAQLQSFTLDPNEDESKKLAERSRLLVLRAKDEILNANTQFQMDLARGNQPESSGITDLITANAESRNCTNAYVEQARKAIASQHPLDFVPEEDFMAIPAIADWRVDGVLHSKEISETELSESYPARSDAESLVNVAVQGPCVVRNQYRSKSRSKDEQFFDDLVAPGDFLLLCLVYEPLERGRIRYRIKSVSTRQLAEFAQMEKVGSRAPSCKPGGSLTGFDIDDFLCTVAAWRIGRVIDNMKTPGNMKTVEANVAVELVTMEKLWNSISGGDGKKFLEKRLESYDSQILNMAVEDAHRRKKEEERMKAYLKEADRMAKKLQELQKQEALKLKVAKKWMASATRNAADRLKQKKEKADRDRLRVEEEREQKERREQNKKDRDEAERLKEQTREEKRISEEKKKETDAQILKAQEMEKEKQAFLAKKGAKRRNNTFKREQRESRQKEELRRTEERELRQRKEANDMEEMGKELESRLRQQEEFRRRKQEKEEMEQLEKRDEGGEGSKEDGDQVDDSRGSESGEETGEEIGEEEMEQLENKDEGGEGSKEDGDQVDDSRGSESGEETGEETGEEDDGANETELQIQITTNELSYEIGILDAQIRQVVRSATANRNKMFSATEQDYQKLRQDQRKLMEDLNFYSLRKNVLASTACGVLPRFASNLFKKNVAVIKRRRNVKQEYWNFTLEQVRQKEIKNRDLRYPPQKTLGTHTKDAYSWDYKGGAGHLSALKITRLMSLAATSDWIYVQALALDFATQRFMFDAGEATVDMGYMHMLDNHEKGLNPDTESIVDMYTSLESGGLAILCRHFLTQNFSYSIQYQRITFVKPPPTEDGFIELQFDVGEFNKCLDAVRGVTGEDKMAYLSIHLNFLFDLPIRELWEWRESESALLRSVSDSGSWALAGIAMNLHFFFTQTISLTNGINYALSEVINRAVCYGIYTLQNVPMESMLQIQAEADKSELNIIVAGGRQLLRKSSQVSNRSTMRLVWHVKAFDIVSSASEAVKPKLKMPLEAAVPAEYLSYNMGDVESALGLLGRDHTEVAPLNMDTRVNQMEVNARRNAFGMGSNPLIGSTFVEPQNTTMSASLVPETVLRGAQMLVSSGASIVDRLL